MIEIGNIVTLENNEELLLLEELEDEGKKYVYTVKVLENETPTGEYKIFEAVTNDQGEYLAPVDDKELYDDLEDQFREIVAEKLIDLDESSDESDNESSDEEKEEAA